MTTPTPNLADLSADDRRRLESLLLKFDQSWDEKRLPAAVRQLPADDPLRRPALVEMIKIDLERRRKAGDKVRVEAYLKPFPELGTADDLPADLILAEYQARRQFGAKADLSEYDKLLPPPGPGAAASRRGGFRAGPLHRHAPPGAGPPFHRRPGPRHVGRLGAAGAVRPIPDRQADRARRHGVGLPGPRQAA